MGHDFNTELTDAERERLAILIEECGEVCKAAGKILRHGYDSQYEHHGDNTHAEGEIIYCDNRGDLERELGDVVHIMQLMSNTGDVNEGKIYSALRIKHAIYQAGKGYLHFT